MFCIEKLNCYLGLNKKRHILGASEKQPTKQPCDIVGKCQKHIEKIIDAVATHGYSTSIH
jgi:hypothetical protein